MYEILSVTTITIPGGSFTRSCRDCGYRLTEAPLIVSPHQFGIPQLRERVIILGKYDPVHVEEPLEITIPTTHKKEENSIYDILDSGKVEDKILYL